MLDLGAVKAVALTTNGLAGDAAVDQAGDAQLADTADLAARAPRMPSTGASGLPLMVMRLERGMAPAESVASLTCRMLHATIPELRMRWRRGFMADLVLAAAQMDVTMGDPGANIASASRFLAEAHELGAELVVFPECALTGYMLDSRADTLAAGLDINGPEVAAFLAQCASQNVHAVIGLLEREGDSVHNSAVLAGPDGLIGVHRKRHLPGMGADRFTDEPTNNDLPVFDTSIGRVGIMICYEIRFPEVARSMALRGADVIALPTNWPMESTILADQFTVVRAAENLVHLVVANRCDEERGMQFLGSSQIINSAGQVLAHAGRKESLVTASVDRDAARRKQISLREDVQLLPWDDRRPASYCI
jgi:predicted amidohydrolase